MVCWGASESASTRSGEIARSCSSEADDCGHRVARASVARGVGKLDERARRVVEPGAPMLLDDGPLSRRARVRVAPVVQDPIAPLRAVERGEEIVAAFPDLGQARAVGRESKLGEVQALD